MAYRTDWERRVRTALETFDLLPDEEVTSRKMFGGLCFLLNGKMWVCIGKERLLVRAKDDAIATSNGDFEPMLHNGRLMKNFFYLPESAFSDEEKLRWWMSASAQYLRENR